jgi:vacuolar iron transporter family protein
MALCELKTKDSSDHGVPGVCRISQTKISFGMTSGIITNLALITGMAGWSGAKAGIIAGILVVGVADNISDSFGIHIYQESECLSEAEVWLGTFTNFISRLLVSLSFAAIVAFLPMKTAEVISIIWGLVLLAVLSYAISLSKGIKPFRSMVEHISIAAGVVLASHFFGGLIASKLQVVK